MLCIHWLVQLMHCLYKALFMSNKTVYSFSYNTAILVVIIFVLSYAARTHSTQTYVRLAYILFIIKKTAEEVILLKLKVCEYQFINSGTFCFCK